MGNPRYRPRSYCDRPDAFGRSPDLHFAPLALVGPAQDTEAHRRRQFDNEVQADAAQWQHEHALVIRRILKTNRMSISAYAYLVGESAKRIGAVLRGNAVMRHDDIERADRVLGSVKQMVRVNQRRKQLREIQSAIDEIQRDSEPW